MALTAEQRANAATIISVGRSLGASERDILIALMAASVESNLINVNYGDRDSIGLFQQRRPWGTDAQRMDPRESARMFFQGGSTGQPGLFDKTSRGSMSMGQAAQAVQVSAFPDRYATQEALARQLLGGAAGTPSDSAALLGDPGAAAMGMGDPLAPLPPPTPSAGILQTGSAEGDQGLNPDLDEFGVKTFNGAVGFLPTISQADFMETMGGDPLPAITEGDIAPVAATGMRKSVVDEALKYVGVDYVWGGTSPSGFDCSGLLQYVYGKFGVDLPRISYAQATYGARIGVDQAQPGDLIAWDNSSRNNGADHIAMYLGDGWILEAPRPGGQVQRRRLNGDEGAWGVDMGRAVR